MKPVISLKKGPLSIDELDRGIVNLSARINAATYELLVLVRQFDERAGWLKWGLANCAEWLHWRCDLSMSAAREKVRVAHVLKTLPMITARFLRASFRTPKSGLLRAWHDRTMRKIFGHLPSGPPRPESRNAAVSFVVERPSRLTK